MTPPDALPVMPLTDARRGLAAAARRAHRQDEPTALSDRGETIAVVISIEEYRELVEIRRQALLERVRRIRRSDEWIPADEAMRMLGIAE